uniref:Uncharacterized protein n=1 Tax=Opuntia streptacantha TaxID=393608 RepID=A0A7C8YR82_OPUST
MGGDLSNGAIPSSSISHPARPEPGSVFPASACCVLARNFFFRFPNSSYISPSSSSASRRRRFVSSSSSSSSSLYPPARPPLTPPSLCPGLLVLQILHFVLLAQLMLPHIGQGQSLGPKSPVGPAAPRPRPAASVGPRPLPLPAVPPPPLETPAGRAVPQRLHTPRKAKFTLAQQSHSTDLIFGHSQSPSCCQAFPGASPRPLPLPPTPSISPAFSPEPSISPATFMSAASSLFLDSAM